jgi:hypothetical protein
MRVVVLTSPYTVEHATTSSAPRVIDPGGGGFQNYQQAAKDMVSVISSRRFVGIALSGLVLMGCGAQLLPENRSRQLAEEFILALQGQAPGGISTYLTPDANVFLQGSEVATLNKGRAVQRYRLAGLTQNARS